MTRSEKSSRYVPKNVRLESWIMGDQRCAKCGSTENLEFDHRQPYSKGGTSSKENIQLLCSSCNEIKSDNESDKKRDFEREIPFESAMIFFEDPVIGVCINSFTKQRQSIGEICDYVRGMPFQTQMDEDELSSRVQHALKMLGAHRFISRCDDGTFEISKQGEWSRFLANFITEKRVELGLYDVVNFAEVAIFFAMAQKGKLDLKDLIKIARKLRISEDQLSDILAHLSIEGFLEPSV